MVQRVVLVVVGLALVAASALPAGSTVPASPPVGRYIVWTGPSHSARPGAEPPTVLALADRAAPVVAAARRAGVDHAWPLRYTPAVVVAATPDQVAALATAPGVARIEPDEQVPTNLVETTAVVGSASANERGVTGAGRSIAVVDTGVDGDHPFLRGRVATEACFTGADCPLGREGEGPGQGAPCSSLCFHGTHVAGIAAGARASDALPAGGVAPGASVVAVQVFTADPGRPPLAYYSDVAQALEWVYDQRQRLDVAAVNLSLGAGRHEADCPDHLLADVTARLTSGGVAVVTSTGNDGYNDAVSAPACVPGIVAVGATTDSDAVLASTNSGPLLDLFAPGQLVRSSLPGDRYGTLSGSSMASAHVSGAFALLRQDDDTSTVADLVERLAATGGDVRDRDGRLRPRIDVRAATRPAPAPPLPEIWVETSAALEGRALRVELTLSEPLTRPASVRVTTSSGTGGMDDHQPVDEVVRLATGATTATVSIDTVDDDRVEGDERLLVGVSDLVGVVASDDPVRPRSAEALIVDDDGGPPAANVRIDVGAAEPYRDGAGRTWSADTGHVGGWTARRAVPVAATDDDAIYRSYRAGAFGYHLRVADGDHLLRLHLAEVDGCCGGPGDRIFDVLVEGVVLAEAVDIARAAGPARAEVIEVGATVVDGLLDVELAPVVGSAMLAGFEILPAAPPARPPSPPPAPVPVPDPLGGYWLLEGDGTVHPFGEVADLGVTPPSGLTTVAFTPTSTGEGLWLLRADGAVDVLGDAEDHGPAVLVDPLPGERFTAISATPDDGGYWVFTDRGRVLAVGSAGWYGDLTTTFRDGTPVAELLNAPVVGSSATPDGRGYHLLAADGGVFAFGTAAFHGSTGSMILHRPVVGLVADPDGAGYWLVAADGGVFAFDAPFRGSVPGVLAPGVVLNRPVIGAVPYADGYLVVAADGGVFNFSGAAFLGSLGAAPPDTPVVAIAASPPAVGVGRPG